MKKVHLIETCPEGLKNIKSHFSEINGHYSVFSSVDGAIRSGEACDLIVLLADKKPETFNRDIDLIKKDVAFSKIPRIVILSFEISETARVAEISGMQTSFRTPVDKRQFLATVAKFLKLPPRRVFETIVTIQPDGSNIKYTGISIDFSETGMALECDSEFSQGQLISVSFINPSDRKRFFLNGQIVRKSELTQKKKTFYGVLFTELMNQDSKDLTSFITGGLNKS